MTTPRRLGTARPIDLAYAEINAMGGYVDPDDETGLALVRQLAEILDILERFGAIDPDLAVSDLAFLDQRSEAA